jgi:selenocysteine lyase/cysteine desulfurase
MSLDVAAIQRDFPLLEREVNGRRITYLDSASSSQKPLAVLDAMDDCYRRYYANIHRGVYTIAEEATAAYELARRKVANFIGAPSTSEVVFVRNATEGINLVAYTWARANLRAGDVVVLTHMEHHANVVPWHILAAERDIELRWIPMTADYQLDPRTSTSCSTARDCSRSPRCRTCSARSTTSGRWPTPRTRTTRWCSSTRASTSRTRRPTCRPGTPTSSRSPPTRCAARAASARYGRARSCSRRCRRSSAAAR